jgi:peptidoglycan-associated lipoprotein
MNRQSVHIKLSTLSGIALAGLLTISAGCHKQVAAVHPPMAPQPVTAQAAPPPAPQRTATVSVVESKPSIPDTATKATIQSLLDRIQDVYFDYNKHAIRPDAERTLDADAKTLREILQDYPTYKLTIEGFCDERGSDEYNLALGDSRARKAEDFLTNLGLPSSQLRTVSFGKEKPVCTEHTEACWQKNRRAHITQEQPS